MLPAINGNIQAIPARLTFQHACPFLLERSTRPSSQLPRPAMSMCRQEGPGPSWALLDFSGISLTPKSRYEHEPSETRMQPVGWE